MTLELIDGRRIIIRPKTFGRDWIAADLMTPDGSTGSCIVPLAAVTGVLVAKNHVSRSLSVHEPSDRGPRITDRIGLAFVLRDLCRRRMFVTIDRISGPARGTIDRVGRDHLDLAIHEAGTARRERQVSHLLLMAFDHIALIVL